MSYFNKKWEFFSGEINEYVYSLEEIRKLVTEHIKNFHISKNLKYDEDIYEITDIKFNIKKNGAE